MSAPFVTQLRVKGAAIQLAPSGPGTITIRVEITELWNAVRVVARPETPVREVKARVVAEFFPDAEFADEFVLKYRGWEILDETASLGSAGLVDGSIVLIGYRRRRPVR